MKILEKIKDAALKERVRKQIIKIIDNPELGKPMRNLRKVTREVYISPHRLSYSDCLIHIANKIINLFF